MLLRDFLTPRLFRGSEHTYMTVNPIVGFAHVLKDGKPHRVMSQSRVVVPMSRWDVREENDLIASVLLQASMQKVFKASNYADLTPQFWAKLTHFLNGLVLNSVHKGKFEVPPTSHVFYSEGIPKNQILCLGTPDRVGTYLIKGNATGVFVKHCEGIASVRLYKAE